MKRPGTLITKNKVEQKETVQQLSSLREATRCIERDLDRVRRTQLEIEVDLKNISQPTGPVTVHQIGNNYFYKKRKHQMLSAVIKERQKLETLHRHHMDRLNSLKKALAQTTKTIGHLTDKYT